MINILVVDDEPVSADGISIYLQEKGDSNWAVRTAYNGMQALEIARQRVDILVSDIRMPGLDGFQVQEKIQEMWPMSRCVFLTSVQQVDYAQRAIRSKTAVDYVLKIEGEEVILDAVRKAVEVQKNECRTRDLLQKAEEEMQQIRPLLQKELVMSLLRGTHRSFSFKERFRELEMPFWAERPVLLILGQIGQESAAEGTQGVFGGGTTDISAFVFNNIMEKYFWPAYRVYTVPLPECRLAVLLQNASSYEKGNARYVFSMMEAVQGTFRQMGGVISLAVDDVFSRWDELSAHYYSLNAVLERNLPMEEALVLRNEVDQLPENSPSEALYRLRVLLENGNYEEAASALCGMKMPYTIRGRLDLYRKLLKLLIATADSQENADRFYETLHVPMPQTDEKGWKNMYMEFAAAFRRFAAAENIPSGRMEQTVEKVCAYVKEHLADDLSLVRLADLMDYSSTYLSRIFKEVKGIGYNDYVVECRMECAAWLLGGTKQPLSEIAAQVGYASSSYFIRTFRKVFGMTPTEYRKQMELKG